MKFTKIHIEGYRSLAKVILPLRPLTVLIGPNGSGKTSILEIFELLRKGAQENLQGALQEAGGLDAVLTKTKPSSDHLKLKVEIDVEDAAKPAPMVYRFDLLSRPVGYAIPFEQLEWQRDPAKPGPYYYLQVNATGVRYRSPENEGWIQPTQNYQSSELALAQVSRMYSEPETLRSTMAKIRKFSSLDVSPRAVVRLPQPLTPTTTPSANGENLYSALYNLRTQHRDVYDQIKDILQLAFPGFTHLDFPLVGAGQATMTWYDDYLSNPLFPGELSEGTLRFLWLITILLSSNPAPVTLIDEPEVSLHPELLKILAGVLQDASTRTQLIIATHSADLIRWLQPDEILVVDKIEGETQVTWADSLNLESWLEEYTLGELWVMGTLGGRP